MNISPGPATLSLHQKGHSKSVTDRRQETSITIEVIGKDIVISILKRPLVEVLQS